MSVMWRRPRRATVQRGGPFRLAHASREHHHDGAAMNAVPSGASPDGPCHQSAHCLHRQVAAEDDERELDEAKCSRRLLFGATRERRPRCQSTTADKVRPRCTSPARGHECEGWRGDARATQRSPPRCSTRPSRTRGAGLADGCPYRRVLPGKLASGTVPLTMAVAHRVAGDRNGRFDPSRRRRAGAISTGNCPGSISRSGCWRLRDRSVPWFWGAGEVPRHLQPEPATSFCHGPRRGLKRPAGGGPGGDGARRHGAPANSWVRSASAPAPWWSDSPASSSTRLRRRSPSRPSGSVMGDLGEDDRKHLVQVFDEQIFPVPDRRCGRPRPTRSRTSRSVAQPPVMVHDPARTSAGSPREGPATAASLHRFARAERLRSLEQVIAAIWTRCSRACASRRTSRSA